MLIFISLDISNMIWPWPGEKGASRQRRYGVATFCESETLWRLEKGNSSVPIGTLAAATFILGLQERFLRAFADG